LANSGETHHLSPLRHAVDLVLAEARVAIDRSASGPPTEAIHAVRVAFKRWRALLRLLEGFVGDEARELRREAGEAARALSRSRDAQAALDALADIMSAPDKERPVLSARSVATITERLDQMRRSEESRARERNAARKLRGIVAHAMEVSATWPLEAIPFGEIARELARSFRRARRKLPGDWRATDPNEVHALRKAIVIFRYQLEVIEPSWPRVWRVFIGETQKLRARLGRSNDLIVLEGLMGARQPLAHWRARLSPSVRRKRQEHLDCSSHLAGLIFAETPRAFRRRLEEVWNAGESMSAP
jgi:CHAD domain-containing protein